jgi:hypothetical protein
MQDIKKFIYRFVIFNIIGCAIFIALSQYYQAKVMSQDYFYQQLGNFDNQPTDPKVVIFGDSRLAFGISPRALPKEYFNFAAPGENLRQTFLKLEYALRKKPGIEFVILAIDDHVMADYRELQRETFVKHMTFSTIKAVAEVYPVSKKQLFRGAIGAKFPLLIHERRQDFTASVYKDLKMIFANKRTKKRISYNGCAGFTRDKYSQWIDVQNKQVTALSHARNKYWPDPFTEPLQDVFRKAVALAAKNEVRVVGLKTPMVREMRQAKTQIDLDERFADLDKFILSQDFYDVINLQTFLNDKPKFFTDPDHLNPDGAYLFSRALVKSMEKITGISSELPANSDCPHTSQ